MAIKHLTEEQIREWTLEQKDRWWLENVFRGDMPQLTLRSAVMGFLLGGVLSATNLYIGAKTGWSLGVGITSVILAFAFFKLLQKMGMSEFTILENNAVQSIATSAGYMTAPLISSLPAYMIISGKLLPAWQIMVWNIVISILGVLFAFPMKRRFINDEQHPFPEGRACGVVLDTLHSSDAKVGLLKAKVLTICAGLAAFIKFLQAESIQEWLQRVRLKLTHVYRLPEDLFEILDWFKIPLPSLRGLDFRQLTIVPALDLALTAAGGLMGIRAGASLLLGAAVNYFLLAPYLHQIGEIDKIPQGGYGLRQITLWSLWPGVSLMVVASLVAFFAKPAAILSAFRGLFGRKSSGDVLKHIEFPLWISLVGIPLVSLAAGVLGYYFFGVPVLLTLVGLPLTFALSLVAANSTALTGTTPVGATSKITQLFYGIIHPAPAVDKMASQAAQAALQERLALQAMQVNLATASITAEVVSNSSNLLMDIKPGYMLGAKPRQQAIGHIIGIFSGALAGTMLFFPLFCSQVNPADPKTLATIQSKEFGMPAVTIWKSVAEIVTKGLGELKPSILWAVIIAAAAGLVLEVARIVSKNKLPFSPVAFGLAFVLDFKSSLCMFAGAFLFWLAGVGRIPEEKAKNRFWIDNHEPICAGVIAGASLMGILDAVVKVFLL